MFLLARKLMRSSKSSRSLIPFVVQNVEAYNVPAYNMSLAYEVPASVQIELLDSNEAFDPSDTDDEFCNPCPP